MHQECGESNYLPMFTLLHIQGASFKTGDGRAAFFTSPNCETISYYRDRLRRANQPTSRDTPQQSNDKRIQRQRWSRSSPNLQPEDVALIREDNTTPLQWPTTIITAVHPGAGNQTRVVTIKTPKGGFKRPI
jgi:hypothetical protein